MLFLGLTGSEGYINTSQMRGASGSALICHCSRIVWFGLDVNESEGQRLTTPTCLREIGP